MMPVSNVSFPTFCTGELWIQYKGKRARDLQTHARSVATETQQIRADLTALKLNLPEVLPPQIEFSVRGSTGIKVVWTALEKHIVSYNVLRYLIRRAQGGAKVLESLDISATQYREDGQLVRVAELPQTDPRPQTQASTSFPPPFVQPAPRPRASSTAKPPNLSQGQSASSAALGVTMPNVPSAQNITAPCKVRDIPPTSAVQVGAMALVSLQQRPSPTMQRSVIQNAVAGPSKMHVVPQQSSPTTPITPAIRSVPQTSGQTGSPKMVNTITQQHPTSATRPTIPRPSTMSSTQPPSARTRPPAANAHSELIAPNSKLQDTLPPSVKASAKQPSSALISTTTPAISRSISQNDGPGAGAVKATTSSHTPPARRSLPTLFGSSTVLTSKPPLPSTNAPITPASSHPLPPKPDLLMRTRQLSGPLSTLAQGMGSSTAAPSIKQSQTSKAPSNGVVAVNTTVPIETVAHRRVSTSSTALAEAQGSANKPALKPSSKLQGNELSHAPPSKTLTTATSAAPVTAHLDKPMDKARLQRDRPPQPLASASTSTAGPLTGSNNTNITRADSGSSSAILKRKRDEDNVGDNGSQNTNASGPSTSSDQPAAKRGRLGSSASSTAATATTTSTRLRRATSGESQAISSLRDLLADESAQRTSAQESLIRLRHENSRLQDTLEKERADRTRAEGTSTQDREELTKLQALLEEERKQREELVKALEHEKEARDLLHIDAIDARNDLQRFKVRGTQAFAQKELELAKALEENKYLQGTLEREGRDRLRVEGTLADFKREASTPFVVPAMLVAFERMAHLTNDALSR